MCPAHQGHTTTSSCTYTHLALGCETLGKGIGIRGYRLRLGDTLSDGDTVKPDSRHSGHQLLRGSDEGLR